MSEKDNAKKAREAALTKGFHGEGTAKLAGHELRPFTFGSFTLCRRLGLTLFTQDGAADELEEDEVMRQLAAFFWLQSQPVESVLQAVREGTAELSIDAFQFEIPVHALPAIMRRVNELSKLASDAAVEIEEKPDSKDDPDAPKN
jgi:hypothetical protein